MSEGEVVISGGRRRREKSVKSGVDGEGEERRSYVHVVDAAVRTRRVEGETCQARMAPEEADGPVAPV